MREMKDSGIEWIGKIPKEWKTVQLKRLAQIQTGNTPSKTKDNLYFSMESGCLWIKAENLGTMCPIERTTEYLTEEGIKIGKLFPACSVYVCCIASVGKVGFCIMPASCNQQINALIFNNAHWKYGFYLTMAQESEYLFNASGNVVKIINSDKQSRLMCPLPPESEQQKIANFLDQQCSEIDTLSSDISGQISTLKEYKKSVITEAVTKGLNPDVEMKDSGIEWIGEIPEHWEVKRVKNIGEYRNGLTYTPLDITDESEGTLVLRSSNVQNGKMVYNDNVYVKTSINPELKIAKGDILICSRNGSRELIGKNAVIEDDLDASFGAFMMIFRCKCPKYMYYILNSAVFTYYLGTFFTSTINQLTGSNFGNMKIVFCNNREEQNDIVNYLDEKCGEIDALIKEKKEQLAILEEYKKSLIYEYVTGKKEVP